MCAGWKFLQQHVCSCRCGGLVALVNLALLLITIYQPSTVEPTLELSSEIYETLTGMTTDVYPRENCGRNYD